jgi:predicted membrane channel-forming protein YqfA (hemolysin III family)
MSLLTWHNETMNIYTHLLPGLFYLCKMVSLTPSGSSELRFLQVVSYLGAATMGITSGLAHLLGIDMEWFVFSRKMDFLGILAINYAHILLDTFLLTKGYWASRELCIFVFFLETVGTLRCVHRIVVSDLEVGRFWAFFYPALTVPLTGLVYFTGIEGTQDSLNCSIYVVIAGVVFFKGGFPERYYNPGGIFDRFGSHTWHHIFIIFSIMAAFEALPKLYLID